MKHIGHKCNFLGNGTANITSTALPSLLEREVYTKGVLSSERPSPSAFQERGLVHTNITCSQGKKKGKTKTPQSLPGVCGGSLRTEMVYRFRLSDNLDCPKLSAPKSPEFCYCDCVFPPQAGTRCDFRHNFKPRNAAF